MIIHVWKILQGVCPNDINMVFKDNPRLGTKVAIPPLAKQASAMAKSCYDNSFAVRAGKLWNLLPKEVKMMSELESFKVSLGAFMDKVPDTPPTPGYTAVNSSSMIDWCSQRGGPQMA